MRKASITVCFSGLLCVFSSLVYAAQECTFSGNEVFYFFKNALGNEKTVYFLDPGDIVTPLKQDTSGRLFVVWQQDPKIMGWIDEGLLSGDCKLNAPRKAYPKYAALHKLPVITLDFDEGTNPFTIDGAYFGTGGAHAVPSGISNCPHSANYFNDDLSANAQFTFYQDKVAVIEKHVIMTISGGCTRVNALKGMTLEVAKEEKKFENINKALFPHREAHKKYESLYLRAGGNDFIRSIFRDGLLQTILLEKITSFPWLGAIDFQDFQVSVLYVNGKYWGVINIREKLNGDYLDTHYGMKKTELSLAEISYGLTDIKGSKKDSHQAAKNLFSQNIGNISKINMDSARGYVAIESYIANDDWPGNNVRLWISNRPEGVWRFLLNDLDLSFGFSGENWKRDYVDYLQNRNPKYFRGEENWLDPQAEAIIKLMKNAICSDRDNFLEKVRNLRSVFSPENVEATARRMQALLEPEIAHHIDLWKGPENSPVSNILGSPVIWSVDSVNAWKSHIENIFKFSKVRAEVIEPQVKDFVGRIGC